jgi:RNA polymerase sigma factor (sigma-70 family)
VSIDAWDPLEAEDESVSYRTLEELLGGDVGDGVPDISDDAGEADAPDAFDARKVDVAYGDLEADVHRTGKPVGSDELHRAAARHELSVGDLAILELRAESAGLLVSAADESGPGAIEWDDFERPTSGTRVDSLMAWFDGAASVPLLDQQQEVALARAIEAGVRAATAISDEGPDVDVPGVRERLETMVERGGRARVVMTTANLRLVASIAKRYRGRGLDFLDLLQEGVLGLMRAVEKFEWRLGYKFSTYATWWIRQAVQRGVANQGRTIRIPVHKLERISKLKKLARQFEIRFHREPTIHELAEASCLDAAEVAFLKDVERDIVSLDRPVRGDPEAATIGELVPDRGVDEFDEAISLSSNEAMVAEFLAMLTERERDIVTRRFGLDDGTPDTLEEIGVSLNLTRERIRQIEGSALKRIADSALASRLKEAL